MGKKTGKLLTKKLIGAVFVGDFKEVKKKIASSVDVNARDNYTERTLLIYAAELSRRRIVRFLLKQGADIEAKTKTGHTLLHAASHGGIDWLVKDLAEKGLDVNAKEKDTGNTPIMFAAWQGHLSTVKLLLELGADINARNKAGKTVLHGALKHNHGDVVDYLIEKKIDMTRTEIQLLQIFMRYRSGR